MSGAEPPVGANSGSSATVLSQHHQQQEITAAQLSDAIRQVIRNGARSQSDELRGWLMLVATLTASITYSAALNPPGGVWQADDDVKGYIAGRPVLRDKFPSQYVQFYYWNAMSFTTSLCIIVLSSTPWFFNRVEMVAFSSLVAVDLFSLAVAFYAGSWTSPRSFVADAIVTLIILAILFFSAKCLGRRTRGHTDQSV